MLPRQDYEPLNTTGLVVEAHECWLRFSIKASEHSTISLHFLPESLWARLLVRCVQFNEMLSGPSPRLTSDWAHLHFGATSFELIQEEDEHSIRVRIHAASPAPIAAQLCELSSQTCRQWLPELRPSVGITVDRHEYDLLDVQRKLSLGKEIFGSRATGIGSVEVYTLGACE